MSDRAVLQQALDRIATLGARQEPAAYEVDGLTPQLVVAPDSPAALQEILSLANEAGLATVPWGGGTQMGLGNLPRAFDLAIDLRKLNAIVQYEPDDLTVAVQAGCTLGELGAKLGAHGQMLPVDFPTADRTTIGGLVATGLSGPRRYGYGALRDLLIGITFALPSGQLSRGGGMVVKNVSGYDMMRLHYGALGSLGVIVQLNFKVIPKPRAERTVVAAYRRLSDAAEAALQVRFSQLAPTAIVLLDALSAQGVGLEMPGWVVSLRCEGPATAVQRQADRISEVVRPAADRVEVLEGHESERLWTEVGGSIGAGRLGRAIRVRIGQTPSELPRLAEEIDRARTGLVVELSRLLDIGSGLCYATLAAERDEDLQLAWQRLSGLGLHATLLTAPPGVKVDTDVFGRQPAGLAVMRALKETFDPNRILNPGRFIGRL
ncbi:FAD-binding oxidoreductase [Thermomicrobiaceae bacterium CFH 74404]|uniref:FAD-binding oxidoreductase n=1 Tax=Thermalbibacter longus TaxID=2951981 RepID=A0AA42BCG8_9BACT|nr:FAD-binding oxidoreductase [Thermalbibacter longus]MCM8748758.1 FAD-binding oxidoreductase [Thermalbibacter longus]